MNEAEKELKALKESPYYEMYVALKRQVEKWNKETKENPVSITSGSEEDSRAFDKALKYFEAIPKILDNMELLRKKMTPEQYANIQEATSDIDNVRESIKNELSNGRENKN